MTAHTGFTISISADANLSVEDIWPDGDAPEAPTTEDVRALIRRLYRSEERFLREWDLLRGIEIDVTGPGGCQHVFGFLADRGAAS